MVRRQRLSLFGLVMVLLAVVAQLAIGSRIPRVEPLLFEVAALCHAPAPSDAPPDHAPSHSSDCLLCPACMSLTMSSTLSVAAAATLPAPAVRVVKRPELPPPATAPPLPWRFPLQPRAPPVLS